MPVEAVFGAVVFIGLFVAWAVLPSYFKRWHAKMGQE